MAQPLYSFNELAEILQEIDEELELELGAESSHEVIIVGGCALLLSQSISRTLTRDIDTLKVDEELEKIIRRHPEVNAQAEVYRDRLPKGFENRLILLPLNTKCIKFLRPSNEDLAVMKLYSWRKQDEEDLLNVTMLSSLDRSLLEKLIYEEGEAKASSNTALLYKRMVETYEESFLPRAKKIAKRSSISGWAD